MVEPPKWSEYILVNTSYLPCLSMPNCWTVDWNCPRLGVQNTYHILSCESELVHRSIINETHHLGNMWQVLPLHNGHCPKTASFAHMATPHIVVQIRTRHNQWDPTFLLRVETPSWGMVETFLWFLGGVGGSSCLGGHVNRWPVDGEPGQVHLRVPKKTANLSQTVRIKCGCF